MSDTPTIEVPPAEAILFRKLAEVMGEVGRVEKRGRNTFHNYDYVTEADLVEAVRSKLAERSVALIPSVEAIDARPYESDSGKHSVVTTARLQFTFVDGETGAMFRASWAGQGDDPGDKGLYSAYTGALKYFLMKTFLIPTGDDPEANTAADERSQGRRGNGGGKPSEKQLGFLKTLLKRESPTIAQIEAVLPGVKVDEGWTDRLSKGEASTLIEALKEGKLPEVPEAPVQADVPGEAPVHERQDDSDMPWAPPHEPFDIAEAEAA